MSSQKRVPVVDMAWYLSGAPRERAQFVQELGDALKMFGFVRVQNHGVEPALVKEAYRLTEALFLLDPAVKDKYESGEGGQRGFVGFGKEHAKNQKVGDLKEFWHVGRELPAGHPLANVYPKNVWPTEVARFREVLLALYEGLEKAADGMLAAIAEYLKLPPDTFRPMTRDGNSILRLINYPPLLPTDDPNAVRAAAHEDINIITLLCEATTSGLEILTREGEWLAIDSLEGQIVMDAGDMLARITNDLIPSTTHRVVNPADGRNVARYSLPFFLHPHPDCVLECLPGCATPENPSKYPPIKAIDFLKQRLLEIGLLKQKAAM